MMPQPMAATAVKKRLFFMSRTPLDSTPYAELPLPALAEDGWDITVASPGASRSLLRSVRPYRCQVEDLDEQGGLLKRESQLLARLLAARTGPYDVIYVGSQSLSTRAWLALVGPKWGKRVVYHTNDYYCPVEHRLHAALEGAFARQADLVVSAEYHRAYIYRAQYRLRTPLLVVPPNLPACFPIPARSADRRRALDGGDEHAFVVMLHGGFSQLRMVPETFAALARLPRHFRLVMTGGSGPDDVSKQLAVLGLADRVVRLPRLGFLDMLAWSVNADASLLLYANNDLGNFFTAPGRLTEYLACGLPLLASDHTGLRDLVERLGLGICVDARHPESIERGLRALAERRARGELSAAELRARFEKHLAFEHWEPRVRAALNQLIGERRRAGQAPPPDRWMPGVE